jgi:HK97 family phage portal protein
MALLDRLRGLFGRKAVSVPGSAYGSGGWYPIIREPFAGAWQRNQEINPALASTFYADFACKTLIARDIAKLRVKLVKRVGDIWQETDNPAFSPVLRKPNRYQTRNQFWESWMLSKLSRGNTYVLKERDNRRVVTALYVLDPRRVTPLIADDGSVFYQLATDDLNVVGSQITVPASEIIHDRMNCDHWLVGIPPIYASGLAAMQGINIQNQSLRLFANNATPGGILTAPAHIPDDTVARLKEEWGQKYGGQNYGKVAVLGDGLKFEKMSLTAVEGQMLEQLKWSAENVCSTYHVPPYKIGVGAMPSYNNVQALNVEYYTQCLQSLIEDAESCLDEALGLGEQYDLGIEFDVENLLRMDSVTQAEVVTKLAGGAVMMPNEGRGKFSLPPTAGGDALYRQQQEYSLEALAKRDARPDPFAKSDSTPPAPTTPANDDAEMDAEAAKTLLALHKGFA